MSRPRAVNLNAPDVSRGADPLVRSQRPRRLRGIKLPVLLCLFAGAAWPLGQARYVESAATPGSFPIVRAKAAASIYEDSNDYAGVARAANETLQPRIAAYTCSSTQAHGTAGTCVRSINRGEALSARPMKGEARNRVGSRKRFRFLYWQQSSSR